MAQAETTVKGITNIDNIPRTEEKIQSSNNGNNNQQVIITPKRECRE